MRLLICAGGTGGGVYPALTVTERLSEDTQVLWVGSEGGMEAELVGRANLPTGAFVQPGSMAFQSGNCLVIW